MIHLFQHVADLPRSDIIFRSQVDRIISSGMLNKGTVYHICVNGSLDKFSYKLDQLQNLCNLHFIQVAKDCLQWEYPTLECLKSVMDSEKENSYVAYIHLKGANQPENSKTRDWRRLMEYFMIDRYKDCIQELNNGYNIVGLNWHRGGINWHFSGNFWWSTRDYIKSLPHIDHPNSIQMGLTSKITGMRYDPNSWRYDHEGWITIGDYKHKEMFNSGVDHYRQNFPEELYNKN